MSWGSEIFGFCTENKKAEKPEKVIEEAQKIQDKLEEETIKEEISKEGIENKEEVNNVNENA